jgi:hypothetical protein
MESRNATCCKMVGDANAGGAAGFHTSVHLGGTNGVGEAVT